jgi:acetyl esterase/lipase
MSLLARILRLLLMLAVIGAIALAVVWWQARPAAPDAFYDPPPKGSREPGALLRSEPFSKTLPAGTKGWRILYATTGPDNAPAVASAVVLVPEPAANGPHPVIAWAHGTTGMARGCAPSVLDHPFANVPAMDKIAAENWVYVATDYVGLAAPGHHAYMVGDQAARAVLDSVRAARRLQGVALDNRVVVWGHSQGGNSALWTGVRAADYAPDVNVVGVAAQAPASDLKLLVAASKSGLFGKIVSAYIVHAYAAAYPDVDVGAYTTWRTRWLAGDIASRCVSLFSALETKLLPEYGIFGKDPTGGPLGARLEQNTPQRPIPAPLFIAQGETDDLVLPQIQAKYVASRCAAGQAVEYKTYAGRDHISLVALDSPLGADLVAWTRDRFAGKPAPSNC